MDILPDESKIIPPKGIEPNLESIKTPIVPDLSAIKAPEAPVVANTSSKFGAIPEPVISQQALAALEGAAKGFAGPLATLIETKGLGVNPENIAQREKDYPDTHNTAEYGTAVASMFAGMGEAGLLAKGIGKLVPEATSVLGKIGASALSSGIQMGAIQGGDEISKAMLGQGNPEAPVSSILLHITAAGLLGAISGGVFNTIGQGLGKGLSALENTKIGDRANDFMAGLGMATKAHQSGIPYEEVEDYLTKHFQDFGAGEQFNYLPYKAGINFYYNGLKNLASGAATTGGGFVGSKVSPVIGISPTIGAIEGSKLADKYITPMIEKILNRPLIGMSKLTAPVVMKVLSTGQTTGLYDALNYASKVSKGAKTANNAIESLFKAGIPSIVSNASDENKIRDFIDAGGVNQQLQNQTEQATSYAEGGTVNTQENPLATIYPAQNMMLNAAKGRISTYLNSLKPQDNVSKLTFDKDFKNEAQHTKYDNAIKIAASPIGILSHVKDGTLQFEHLQHFSSMYPEVYQHLKDKLAARITKAQIDKETLPNFPSRMAMSMFLGTPLDSSMSPQNILAAQSSFMPTALQQQAQGKTKKGTSTLGKSNNMYKTTTQEAESDRSDRK